MLRLYSSDYIFLFPVFCINFDTFHKEVFVIYIKIRLDDYWVFKGIINDFVALFKSVIRMYKPSSTYKVKWLWLMASGGAASVHFIFSLHLEEPEGHSTPADATTTVKTPHLPTCCAITGSVVVKWNEALSRLRCKIPLQTFWTSLASVSFCGELREWKPLVSWKHSSRVQMNN